MTTALAPIGVLLLHGFTSSIKTVDGLVPYLTNAKIPYRMPVLRGHGTRPEHLKGVTYSDWIDDAEDALSSLLDECRSVVVVGLSMGGLVALELGIRHGARIAAVVAVAPALRFVNPLARFSVYMHYILRYFPGPQSFTDPQRARANENYIKFPVKTFASLYQFSRRLENKLSLFTRPLLILQHRKAQVTSPKSATLIYDKVSTPEKKIIWFEKSGHEMMQDCEKEKVFEAIMGFIRNRGK